MINYYLLSNLIFSGFVQDLSAISELCFASLYRQRVPCCCCSCDGGRSDTGVRRSGIWPKTLSKSEIDSLLKEIQQLLRERHPKKIVSEQLYLLPPFIPKAFLSFLKPNV